MKLTLQCPRCPSQTHVQIYEREGSRGLAVFIRLLVCPQCGELGKNVKPYTPEQIKRKFGRP